MEQEPVRVSVGLTFEEYQDIRQALTNSWRGLKIAEEGLRTGRDVGIPWIKNLKLIFEEDDRAISTLNAAQERTEQDNEAAAKAEKVTTPTVETAPLEDPVLAAVWLGVGSPEWFPVWLRENGGTLVRKGGWKFLIPISNEPWWIAASRKTVDELGKRAGVARVLTIDLEDLDTDPSGAHFPKRSARTDPVSPLTAEPAAEAEVPEPRKRPRFVKLEMGTDVHPYTRWINPDQVVRVDPQTRTVTRVYFSNDSHCLMVELPIKEVLDLLQAEQ